MQAKDIMTTRVVTVSENATVLDAARLMAKRRISGLPVVDANGDLVGILTEGDLLRRTEIATEKSRSRLLSAFLNPGRLADEYTHTHGRKVGEVMTPEPVFVSEDTPLEKIVQLIEKKRVRRLPVLRDGQLIGIVARANLVRAYIKAAAYSSDVNASDDQIRARILSDIEKAEWAPTAAIDVNVAAGVVTLFGTIFDDRERAALKVLAENIPGVRAVQDELVWVEPNSGLAIGPETENRSVI